MLSAHIGDSDIPVWTLATAGGQYCLRETEASPEGPVLFTSPEAAHRFLTLHEELWGELMGARIISFPGTLKDALDLWARADRVAEPTVYLDVRPSLGGFGSFDAEYLH